LNKKIGIIVSRFNEPVTSRLLVGCQTYLRDHGVSIEQQEIVWVPGAVEIPLLAQTLAKRGEFSAIICLGAVIRGETGHYDFVCQQVSDGVMRVMLTHHLPVVFGVLTTDNADQAFARAGGKKGNKGEESAKTALEMIKLIAQYTRPTD
jgi:6,7-dimethyl-8-ribityllumazine synthase